MRLHRLSKRDARRITSLLNEHGYEVEADEEVRVAEEEDTRLYTAKNLVFVELGGSLLPLIDESVNREVLSKLPSIIVDMGAVPHIVNGADVMRPGVVRATGPFSRDGVVVIRDERHGKALALGRALIESSEIPLISRGRVAENLHYVGDRAWRVARRLLERM